MKINKGFLLVTLSLLLPVTSFAQPGPGPGNGPGPGWRNGPGWHDAPGWRGRPEPHHRHPGRLSILPGAAVAVLIGGLTYYALNGYYYQRQNDNSYLMVQPPLRNDYSGQMRALDYNGERFYVQDGHYYRRDINGHYLEVPRPAGL